MLTQLQFLHYLLSRIVIALFYQHIDVDYPCEVGENRDYPQR